MGRNLGRRSALLPYIGQMRFDFAPAWTRRLDVLSGVLIIRLFQPTVVTPLYVAIRPRRGA